MVVAVLLVGGVATYQHVARSGATPADASDAELVGFGAPIYAETCASCHGKSLEGQPNWKRRLPEGGMPAPPHDASGHTWHHPDPLLFEITKFGGQAYSPPGYQNNMPAFGAQLSDREIWAVLAFIKSRWPQDVQARQREINEQAK